MCAGPHRNPRPRPKPGARAKSPSEEPQFPPRPLQVDTRSRIGRHPPCTVLVCPRAGSTCLPDRRSSTRLLSPRPASPLPNPLLATRCTLTALHSFIRVCCRRPPIPHSLLCTFQSNPIQPAVLSFYRPPIPARTSCRASIVSQTLFHPLVQPCGPNIRSIANRPTVLPFVKPHRQRLVIRQPSLAQPARPSDRETTSTHPLPSLVLRQTSPRLNRQPFPPKHC